MLRFRVLDRIVAPFPRAELRAAPLIERARRSTGLDDLGADAFRKRLDLLCDDVDRNGNLSAFGRLVFSRYVQANLESRLRALACLARHPEIERLPLAQPVFITGWYRTGSTLLHNLLTETGDFRVPRFWELRYPCPAVDPRAVDPAGLIRRTRWNRRFQAFISPGFSDAHALDALRPDECLHLFEPAALSTMALFLTQATDYARRLLETDVTDAYAFYRSQLKILTWLRPGAPWLLKWPYHSWHLGTLFETFRDARVIRLHRPAEDVLPSTCRLVRLARQSLVRKEDPHALGRFWMEYCAAGKERADAVAAGAHAKRIFDLDYRDLVADPGAALEKIGGFLRCQASD